MDFGKTVEFRSGIFSNVGYSWLYRGSEILPSLRQSLQI